MSKLLIIIISISVVLGIAIFWVLKKVYQKINELIYQNRLLSALRSLDQVALSSTDLKTVCQGIVDVTRKELDYLFGGIALLDEEGDGIRRMAISGDPKLDQVLKDLPIEFQQQVVPLKITNNLLVKAVLEKKVHYSTDLYSIQMGIFPKELSKNIQQFLNFQSLYVYPLMSANEVIGVLYYALRAEKEKIPQFELKLMKDFTDEASRILENVLLYQRLKNISLKLSSANQQLKELDKIKNEFISVTSHELRTPMTAIRSYAWMALHRSDMPLSKTVEKYLIRVLISTERLINLVNDMLNISRIESGKIEINPEAVDVISITKDIVDETYYSKATDKNVQFVVLEERLPKVFADPEKLRQVFLNVVGNALKFSPMGGKITISFFTDGKEVEVFVKDQGLGISRDDMGRLFKKFGRLDSSFTSSATSGGTGLGLYISKSLVELMHGRIWAKSEGLGKGATFAFSLPVAK